MGTVPFVREIFKDEAFWAGFLSWLIFWVLLLHLPSRPSWSSWFTSSESKWTSKDAWFWLIHGSIQAFGLGSSSIQTKGFRGEKGCGTLRIWVRALGQCPRLPWDWRSSLLSWICRVPSSVPVSCVHLPMMPDQQKEKSVLGCGRSDPQLWCSRAADHVRTSKPA